MSVKSEPVCSLYLERLENARLYKEHCERIVGQKADLDNRIQQSRHFAIAAHRKMEIRKVKKEKESEIIEDIIEFNYNRKKQKPREKAKTLKLMTPKSQELEGQQLSSSDHFHHVQANATSCILFNSPLNDTPYLPRNIINRIIQDNGMKVIQPMPTTIKNMSALPQLSIHSFNIARAQKGVKQIIVQEPLISSRNIPQKTHLLDQMIQKREEFDECIDQKFHEKLTEQEINKREQEQERLQNRWDLLINNKAQEINDNTNPLLFNNELKCEQNPENMLSTIPEVNEKNADIDITFKNEEKINFKSQEISGSKHIEPIRMHFHTKPNDEVDERENGISLLQYGGLEILSPRKHPHYYEDAPSDLVLFE